jgi:large subunit ribosomal protein L23
MSTTEIIDVEAEKPAKKAVAKKVAPKKAKKSEEQVPAALKVISRFASETIIAPLVTEKTASLGSKNVLVFRIASNATRVAVKQAIAEIYGVTPVKVNVITVRPRAMTFGRTQGTTKGYKKAMVTLPPGKTIDVFAA